MGIPLSSKDLPKERIVLVMKCHQFITIFAGACHYLYLFVTLTGEDDRLLSLLFSSAHNALHGARVQEQPSAQARLDGVHLMALQVTAAGPTTCATKSNRGRGICAFGASASATWNDLIWGDQM